MLPIFNCNCLRTRFTYWTFDWIVLSKKNEYNKQYGSAHHQAINCFDKIHRKCLRDNVIDEQEYEALCNTLAKNVSELTKDSVLEIKF